jgi:hypothetical protein
MNSRRLFAAVLCVGVCVLTHASPAEACGCGGDAPLSRHVSSATAVFIGTVETVTGGMPRPIVATFSVAKAYRSALQQRVVISGNGTTCDIAFAKGVTYLVYANEHAGVLSTFKCTRTRPLSGAAEDVRYLDNLTAGRPQVLVYGAVFRRIIRPDRRPARQALFEPLRVVALSARGRRSVITDQWGPYQLVLAPGAYELWVERRGQPVTARTRLSLRTGDERRLSFTADYP